VSNISSSHSHIDGFGALLAALIQGQDCVTTGEIGRLGMTARTRIRLNGTETRLFRCFRKRYGRIVHDVAHRRVKEDVLADPVDTSTATTLLVGGDPYQQRSH